MFGNNLDVLTPEELPRAQGYCGGWGGGNPHQSAEAALASVELVLDLAMLEDGRCIGPDEFALYAAVNESLHRQRTTAQEAVDALQAGASIGRIFEIVRPLARRHTGSSQPVLPGFGMEALHFLVDASDADLLAFFEKAATPRSLELRRVR